MIKSLMKSQKGFTLVEILIVVSLIAILAVVALVTINPAEAQRRARDTQRIKDIASLQSIMEQYITDNPNALAAGTDIISQGGTNACSGGWIGLDLCPYANTLPIDPINKNTVVAMTGATPTENDLAVYELIVDTNNQYHICARLESRANVSKLTTDGSANEYFEVFSITGLAACNGAVN